MTILLDTDNKKVLSISSGGFVNQINGTLQYKGNTHNLVEYNGKIPEAGENQILEWDDINKKLIVKEI